MRVVMVSKALVVGAYQRKAEELARLGIELTVLIPPFWQELRGRLVAETHYTHGYQLQIIPLRFNGNFHLHYYPTLARELARLRPQLLHMDEEPYNLATWLALRTAERTGVRSLFFTWQNLWRRYPPPFCWWEQANYRRARHVLAGNQEAVTVLQRKGYGGPVTVIPQFGVDPLLFAPRPRSTNPTPVIGYAGGLAPGKGVDLLLRACASLRGAWHLRLAGAGQEQANLQQLAQQLGIGAQVTWLGSLASTAMPDFYHSLDLLVLPSRTLPNWKEQFGRVLVEAMACGLPVVGSSCGEIPQVIGTAGLIFPEGKQEPLRQQLQTLLDQPNERQRLGELGRQRVQTHYTLQQVAQQTVAVYRQVLQG